MADGTKSFNTKSELFTEYSEKNRYLLDLIKKERRKVIDEKNIKKNLKYSNTSEKDKKRKSITNSLNSLNKSVYNTSNIKIDLKDRNNNFSLKNKSAMKSGAY